MSQKKHSKTIPVAEFIATARKQARPVFAPYAQYCPVADAVFIYLSDLPTHLDRVDPTYSVLVDDSGNAAGVILKGIKARLGLAPAAKVTVKLVMEAFVRSQPEMIWNEAFQPARVSPVMKQQLSLA